MHLQSHSIQSMADINIASGSPATQGFPHNDHHSSRCSQTGMCLTGCPKLMLGSGVELRCQVAKQTALSRVGDGGRGVGFDSAQLPMHKITGHGHTVHERLQH